MTKDIAPYQVVAGNPARPIKDRLNFVPPSQIMASNQKDLPYFYLGFEHHKPQEKLAQNGMKIIDNAIVKLKLESPQLLISGWAKEAFELQIKLAQFSEVSTCSKGDFQISCTLPKMGKEPIIKH